MSPDDTSRERQIFNEAADLSHTQRLAYLEQACGDDANLRAEMDRLLNADANTDSLFDESGLFRMFAPEERPQTLSAGDRIGRFEIVGLLGKGGMGEVYEAQDLHFGDRVALKTIRSEFLTRPDFAARFRREILLARKVTHPNVCRLYDVGRQTIRGSEIAYLTMELLSGETLQERIKRGPVPYDEALTILRQILLGLEALHHAEVIHRDLKPANILLVDSLQGMRVVITDFGLAHSVERLPTTQDVTVIGQLLGTPAYMSPEQLAGNQAGPTTDIYALGIVMYELLTGARPFESKTFLASASEKATRVPMAPSRRNRSLDSRWNDLMLDCLDRRPAKRPQSMRAVSERFQRASSSRRRLALPNPHWALDRNLYKPTIYGAAAIAILALIPRAPGAWTAPVRRQLCTAFPGQAAWCALPAQKHVALLPFKVSGSDPSHRAAAQGLSSYLRSSLERMYPDPGKMCLHLRSDDVADGVTLAVEGNIEAAANAFTIRLFIREAKGENGAQPARLRSVVMDVPFSKAKDLHAELLSEFARALEIDFDSKAMDAWRSTGPSHSDSFVSYLQGVGYLDTGKYQQAVTAFGATLSPTKDFAFAPAQVGLGDAFRLLRNTTGDPTYELSARQAYQRALPLDRQHAFAGAAKRSGELDLEAGHTAAAISHFENALAEWPYDLRSVRALATLYDAAGQPGRAENALKQAVARAPQCWLAHNALADYYSRHGRVRDAEKVLLEAIRLAPDNASAYHNLAFDYIKVGRFDDAIEMASKAIAVRPFALAYSTLGRAYMYRNCSSDALVNLRAATKMDAEDYLVWANLAEALYATDPRGAEARDAYNRTVSLTAKELQKSPSAYARAQHALNLVRLGRRDEAVADAERSIAEGGASNDTRLLAVATFDLAGMRPRAFKELQLAFKNSLPLHEAEASVGLAALRTDPQYADMLRRLGINRSAHPGGLTPRSYACPDSRSPGTGLTGV